MGKQHGGRRLQEASSEEADRLFLRLMIPHHKAALGVTEAVPKETVRPEVEGFAGAISASQGAEISTVEKMLRDRGGGSPASEPPDDGETMPGMGHGG